MMKILVLPIVLWGLIVAAPQRAAGATDPLLKCASSKLKAVAKLESARLNCLSKNVAKPDPVKLGACVDKANGALAPAFTKADAKGACAGRAQDLGAIPPPGGTAEGCAQSMAAAIPADTCNTTSGHCVAASTVACTTDLDCLVKCTSAKLKAAGKAASGGLNCYSKAVGKGIEKCDVPSGHCVAFQTVPCTTDLDCVDPACTTKADTGLTTALTKADVKGACPPAVNAGVNSQVTAQCVTPVKNQLPGKAPGCGNGVLESYLGETCDDGNTKNGDSCPANCHVDSCTPTATSFGAHVTFTSSAPAGTTISGLGFFVDYPEGKVGGLATTQPFGVSGSVNDLGYGFTANSVKLGGLPSPVLTLSFKTCQGAPAAVAGDFSCTVTDASDDNGNTVDPSLVTCTVTVP
jgi:cysteine-rich repeat protein